MNGGEKITFGDYKVNCDEEDPDATKGWAANADTFNTFTAVGLFDKSYIYCPAWMAEALGEELEKTIEPGWYDSNDEEFSKNCNNTEIPFGKGTIAKTTGVGATVQFAGEVKNSPTTTDIGAFTIAGNVSPVDIKIGDLIVNCDEEDPDATKGWAANADTINLFTDVGLFDQSLIYCPAWMAEALSDELGYTVVPGWYSTNDEEFSDCLNTKISFKAGEGFIAKATGAGATITVVSAIK